MKVLRAGIVMLEDTTEGDMDEPVRLTKRVAPAPLVPSKSQQPQPTAVQPSDASWRKSGGGNRSETTPS
jgi:hypothetical protein